MRGREPSAFAQECEIAAKNLRRLPKDLRRELSHEVKDQVATPLAGKISAAARGPWARVLRASVKPRASADPKIVIGGASPKLKGGGRPTSVLYGAEFGGGKRVTVVPSRPGRAGYRRHSTKQFANHHDPYIFSTIAENGDWVLERFADIVDKVINEGVPNA